VSIKNIIIKKEQGSCVMSVLVEGGTKNHALCAMWHKGRLLHSAEWVQRRKHLRGSERINKSSSLIGVGGRKGEF
jgi:hypothetical protein